MPTTYENKVSILTELWEKHREEEGFKDFVEYNDIGLPLAFMITHGLVEPTKDGVTNIDETFALLLAGMGIEDDPGFESYEDLMTLE